MAPSGHSLRSYESCVLASRYWAKVLRRATFPAGRRVRDMLVADLPRRQRFGKALLIELRVGARPRHRPYVDNEADARLSQEIDKFDDRPGRVAYGEKGVRVIAPSGRRRVTAGVAVDPKRPIRKQKRVLVGKILRFQGTDREGSGWMPGSNAFNARTASLQFFGGLGSNDRAEELQDP